MESLWDGSGQQDTGRHWAQEGAAGAEGVGYRQTLSTGGRSRSCGCRKAPANTAPANRVPPSLCSTRVLWFCSITVLLSAALLPASSGTQTCLQRRMWPRKCKRRPHLAWEQKQSNTSAVKQASSLPKILIAASWGWGFSHHGPCTLMGWDGPGRWECLVNLPHWDLPSLNLLPSSSILGVRAVEPPEEAEISRDVEPGSKVVSGSAWARWVARQAQAGPEQDLDHLHHSRDDAGKPDAYGPPLMLSLQVQNGPEEDHDHLHHH
ncbi:uncharacterized protein LOC133209440 [Neopsephotus bourkii]|uniref:uncharacterized protein LOC133209440 n=1 Tax=Neopsephotus bourkii TaxID=309878 RepID=UPI002AA5422A|nr:uncharacterized protein LOC133209440 [Neopsephotus bourkii]